MEALIIIGLIILCFVMVASSFLQAARFRSVTITKTENATVKVKDPFVDIPWEQFGDTPIQGDSQDQGAVDVALKIRDLQYKEAASAEWSEKAYYEGQIRENCDLLVELTLLQVAPPVQDEALDCKQEPASGSNVAFAAHRFGKQT